MIGAIGVKEILGHPITTVQCFGWTVFLRSLFAGRDETFLSLLTSSRCLECEGGRIGRLIERCVGLELGARESYAQFAERFAATPAAEFFRTLARQEGDHAELLGVCRAQASCSIAGDQELAGLEASTLAAEEAFVGYRARARDAVTLPAALQLVIEIERSEVNRLFSSVVASTASPFVRAVGVFHSARDQHLSYICREVPRLSPQFAPACRDLAEFYGVEAG